MRGPARAIAVAAALTLWAAVPQAQVGRSDTSPTMATVGARKITRAEFDQRQATAGTEYGRRAPAPTPEVQALFDRQVLEGLIRAQLLILEAERQGITIADEEAEARLQADPFFQKDGKLDADKYQAIKVNQPEAFRQAIETIKKELGGRRLDERIRRTLQVEEAEIRAEAWRSLVRADLQYLALRRDEFDGSYPEPRESDILAYYRTHAKEFWRSDRAVLSVMKISESDLTESTAPVSPEVRTREAALKQRADSALAALREGSSMDEVADAFGGYEDGVVVTPDQFPGYWRGNPSRDASIFKQAPGTVFPEPIPGRDGWLIVRVDELRKAGVAPLREVSTHIRRILREDSQLHHDDRELLAMYESLGNRLHGFAYRLRYAVADDRVVEPGDPSEQDLDRFYRGHLADYTSYDATTGSLVSKPLEQVRDEVRARWRHERRTLLTLSLAEKLLDVWNRGKRDRKLESSMVVREVGPLPIGARVDTGLAGAVLTDTLARRGIHFGPGVAPFQHGIIVYSVFDTLSRYMPTFSEIRPVLSHRLRAQRGLEIERAAREMYESDPSQVISGNILRFTRLMCSPPDVLEVPLTRNEVERYHRENIARYSAPEMIGARHILVSPKGSGPQADAAARRKAEDLLGRIRAGEDFARLAEEHSDDPPTRGKGGDLGHFARGTMLEQFERAAFAMRPGEVSDLVKTEVGYHIIKVTHHAPMVSEPLVHIYSNVGVDAATDKAKRLARQLADSLYRVIETPADARAAARKLGLDMIQFTHRIGDRSGSAADRAQFAKLEQLNMGELYPGVVALKDGTSVIQWPDSITPVDVPPWHAARERAISRYLGGAAARAVDAKIAELDSLLNAGWSFDSLGALWGGLETFEARAGKGLGPLKGADIVDSLVFGAPDARELEPGGITEWLAFEGALVRIRLNRILEPSTNQMAGRIESERRMTLERKLFDYFTELKRRYPVRILDPRLSDINLPPPPDRSST